MRKERWDQDGSKFWDAQLSSYCLQIGDVLSSKRSPDHCILASLITRSKLGDRESVSQPTGSDESLFRVCDRKVSLTKDPVLFWLSGFIYCTNSTTRTMEEEEEEEENSRIL